MATIIAKQTIVGEYGRAKAGEEIQVKKSVAKQLVDKGVADLVTDEGDEPETSSKGGLTVKGPDGKILYDTKTKESKKSEQSETKKSEAAEAGKADATDTKKATPTETKKSVSTSGSTDKK